MIPSYSLQQKASPYQPFRMVEAAPQGLPFYCQRRTWTNGTDTGRPVTYLLPAIYCYQQHNEKVSIKRVRELRIKIQNEGHVFGSNIKSDFNLFSVFCHLTNELFRSIGVVPFNGKR